MKPDACCSQVCNALRYNISGLKELWPFILEVHDVDHKALAARFMRSRLAASLFAMARDTHVRHPITALLQEFLQLAGGIMMSAHSRQLVVQCIRAPPPTVRHDRPMSVTRCLCDAIGTVAFNVFVVDECVVLLANIVYLAAVYGVVFQRTLLQSCCTNLAKVASACRVVHTKQVYDDAVWLRTHACAAALHRYIQCALAGQQMNKDALFRLTSVGRHVAPFTAWPFNIPCCLKSHGHATAIPHADHQHATVAHRFVGAGYAIPCWNSGCNRAVCDWAIAARDASFTYCPRCHVASYCSATCSALNRKRHRRVCARLARPPTMLRYFQLHPYTQTVLLPPRAQRLCTAFEEHLGFLDAWSTRSYDRIY